VTQPFVRLAGAAVTQPSGLVRARTDDWRARVGWCRSPGRL